MPEPNDARLADLERDVASLLDNGNERDLLASGVNRLAEATVGLNGILLRVNEQQRQLHDIEDKTDELADNVEETVRAQRLERRRTVRRLTWLGLIAGLLALSAVLGSIWLAQAYRVTQMNRTNVRGTVMLLRAACERANERQRATATREQALAVIDLPVTREIHAQSALTALRQIADCVAVYPLPEETA